MREFQRSPENLERIRREAEEREAAFIVRELLPDDGNHETITPSVLGIIRRAGSHRMGQGTDHGSSINRPTKIHLALQGWRTAKVDDYFRKALGTISTKRLEAIVSTAPSNVEIAKDPITGQQQITAADLAQWLARTERRLATKSAQVPTTIPFLDESNLEYPNGRDRMPCLPDKQGKVMTREEADKRLRQDTIILNYFSELVERSKQYETRN